MNWTDVEFILGDINVNLVLVVIYISILSLFVEGIVEIIKIPTRAALGITPDKKIDKLEKERWSHLQRAERVVHDEGLKEFYGKMADQTLEKIQQEWHGKMQSQAKGSFTWFNILFPIMIGVGIVLLFYPLTVFSFLPFGPHSEPVGTAITAVLISRGSNGAHGAFNKLGGVFESLIGRIGRF